MNHRFISQRIGCSVIAAMAFCLDAWGASVTVVLPHASGAPNVEIKVPVLVKGAQGLGPLQMDLLFDSTHLKFVKAAEGTGFGVGLFDFNLLEPGRLRLVMTGDPNKPIQGDGELFAVTLQVAGSASGQSPLTAEKVRAWEQTLDAFEMRVTVEPGSVTIASPGIPIWLLATGATGFLLLLFALIRVLRKKPVATQVLPPAPATLQVRGRFCSSCGAQLSPNSKFCPSCGQGVGR
jgi:hypothetical protein